MHDKQVTQLNPMLLGRKGHQRQAQSAWGQDMGTGPGGPPDA